MSEEATISIIQQSPLQDAHARSGAQLREQDGWLVPTSYGDAEAEYRAVRDGTSVGLIDLSSRGRIELEGAEVVQFLNGMITNDVKALSVGAWMLAAFPNVQGRLIAFTRVLRLSENSFLLDTESATHERVRAALERFTLAGDFRVRDATHETAHLSLQGARAQEIINNLFGDDAARLDHNKLLQLEWQAAHLNLIRATHTGENGFDVFANADKIATLWQAFAEAGARPVGFDALETLRVEAGVPRYGADMDEANVVLEIGLDEAISYTKGCYVGQEIIARIHWRGHVARRIAGLNFDDANAEIEVGDKLQSSDGKEAGRITSTVFSPVLNQRIALAYVRYAYLAPDTELKVLTAGGEQGARVVKLPFVRGSWHENASS